jgi:hypothetical protein
VVKDVETRGNYEVRLCVGFDALYDKLHFSGWCIDGSGKFNERILVLLRGV